MTYKFIEDFIHELSELGVKKGDALLIHSDLFAFVVASAAAAAIASFFAFKAAVSIAFCTPLSLSPFSETVRKISLVASILIWNVVTSNERPWPAL